LEFNHAWGEVEKVLAVRSFLEHAGLHAYAYPYRLDEFYRIQERLPGDTDLVLAVANEFGAYREIQSSFPPTVVHASTSPNWVVTLGHHRPIVDPCVAGVYGDGQAPMKCGTGAVGSPGEVERAVGSLPFLAPAAATLLLAQVLRIGLGVGAPSHVLRSLNLRSETPSLSGFPAPDPEKCMCKSQDASLHRQFLGPRTSKS